MNIPSMTISSVRPDTFTVEVSGDIVNRLIYVEDVVEIKDENGNISYQYNQWVNNCYFKLDYNILYPALIHLKYTLDDEYNLVINKKDTKEYLEYIEYKAKCKEVAMQYIGV